MPLNLLALLQEGAALKERATLKERAALSRSQPDPPPTCHRSRGPPPPRLRSRPRRSAAPRFARLRSMRRMKGLSGAPYPRQHPRRLRRPAENVSPLRHPRPAGCHRSRQPRASVGSIRPLGPPRVRECLPRPRTLRRRVSVLPNSLPSLSDYLSSPSRRALPSSWECPSRPSGRPLRRGAGKRLRGRAAGARATGRTSYRGFSAERR